MKKNKTKASLFQDRSALGRGVYLSYSLLIVAVVLSQLFTLVKLAENSLFVGLAGRAFLLGVVVGAVFSLPYVLNLRTSNFVRFISFCLTAFLPLLWLIYSFALVSVSNFGLFSSIAPQEWVSFSVVVVSFLATSVIVCIRGIPSLKSAR